MTPDRPVTGELDAHTRFRVRFVATVLVAVLAVMFWRLDGGVADVFGAVYTGAAVFMLGDILRTAEIRRD